MLGAARGRGPAADYTQVHILFQHPFKLFLNPWLDAKRMAQQEPAAESVSADQQEEREAGGHDDDDHGSGVAHHQDPQNQGCDTGQPVVFPPEQPQVGLDLHTAHRTVLHALDPLSSTSGGTLVPMHPTPPMPQHASSSSGTNSTPCSTSNPAQCPSLMHHGTAYERCENVPSVHQSTWEHTNAFEYSIPPPQTYIESMLDASYAAADVPAGHAINWGAAEHNLPQVPYMQACNTSANSSMRSIRSLDVAMHVTTLLPSAQQRRMESGCWSQDEAPIAHPCSLSQRVACVPLHHTACNQRMSDARVPPAYGSINGGAELGLPLLETSRNENIVATRAVDHHSLITAVPATAPGATDVHMCSGAYQMNKRARYRQ
jgi:hypothetical protein